MGKGRVVSPALVVQVLLWELGLAPGREEGRKGRREEGRRKGERREEGRRGGGKEREGRKGEMDI